MAQQIKALCITEDPDRPTTAMFVGLKDAGVDVTVICPAGERRAWLEQHGVRVLDVPLRKQIDREAVRRLRAELESGRYDILHLFSNKALQNGLAASRGLPVKIVAYRGIVGNVSFLSPVSWLRFLNPRIDRIVCVAEAVRTYFLRMRPAFLRLPPERLVTIYKGHSLEWYRAVPAELSALGVPAGSFAIACVANYRPRKGIEVLVDAFGRLPAAMRAHLLLIGGGMDAPRLTRCIAQSPARERIHVLGYRSDAPSVTAACDVFVLPSTKREGLARSLIEAMAYGVAPIVTDCGGSPELVVHGSSGLVVPVGDAEALANAIRELHGDEQLRARLGGEARERIARDFRIEDTIAKTHALYAALVAERLRVPTVR
jgi:glycosyltransferase involved in cell wall biosynthesis